MCILYSNWNKILVSTIFLILFSLYYKYTVTTIHFRPESMWFIQSIYTSDSWITWVWTHKCVGPLISRHFFFSINKYYSTTWFTTGWICECGTTDIKEPWIQRANYKVILRFSAVSRIGTPWLPCCSIYYTKYIV